MGMVLMKFRLEFTTSDESLGLKCKSFYKSKHGQKVFTRMMMVVVSNKERSFSVHNIIKLSFSALLCRQYHSTCLLLAVTTSQYSKCQRITHEP